MVYLKKYGETELVKPLDGLTYSEDFAKEFKANFKLIGTESVNFQSPLPASPNDLSLGKIYFCYLDREQKYMLPSTFILVQAKLQAPASSPDTFYYDCEGVGINDLLYRVFVNIDRKNIKFRDLIIEIIEQTRAKIPQISNDYTHIADLDFKFALVRESAKYAGQLFEDFRTNLKYEIYIRPDLKIYANIAGQNIDYSLNFDQNTINGQRAIIEDWSCGPVNPIAPTTSIIAVGGFADSGTESQQIFNGTGEPATGALVPLSTNINIDDNYALETFDSAFLDNTSGESQTGTGWDKRFRTYDQPLDVSEGLETQIKFELNNKTGKTHLSALGDGVNYNPGDITAGFMVDGQSLGLLVNGLTINSGILLKPFESIPVTALNPGRTVLTVASLAGSTLAVGDTVQVTGLSSAAALNAVITDITGLNITISIAVSDGALTGLKIVRKTQYLARWLMIADNSIKYQVKIGNGEFIDLGTYSVSFAQNTFATIYNNNDGAAVETVGNGVWSVGSIDLDYWFIDFHKFLKIKNSAGKLLAVPSDYSDTVYSDAVIDTVDRNGITTAEISFYLPGLLRTITQVSTTTRLFCVLGAEDFITTGMRVLVNGEAATITGFFKDELNPLDSYIDVSPLSTAPALDTAININTSVPARGEVITIDYLELRRLLIRECNELDCFNQYGYKEAKIDVPEITNLIDLVDRAQDTILSECTPQLQGNFGFILDLLKCDNDSTFKPPEPGPGSIIVLPSPGNFISVTYTPRGKDGLPVESIEDESVIIQDYSIAQTGALKSAEGMYLSVAYNFGLPENTNWRQTTSLLKQFAVFRGTSEDINYNIPCLLKDVVTITDTLTAVESNGFAFVSGQYQFNFSGARDFVELTESITAVESNGFAFVSGQYQFNFSGAN